MKCPTPLPSSPNFPSNSCASCIMWPDIIKIRLYKNKCWHQTEITHYFRTTEYGIHARYLPNNTNSLGFPAWYLHQRTRRGDSQIFPSNISDMSVPSDDAERCIRVNCNQSHPPRTLTYPMRSRAYRMNEKCSRCPSPVPSCPHFSSNIFVSWIMRHDIIKNILDGGKCWREPEKTLIF